MIVAVKLIICILSLFSALSLCYALWIGLRRDTRGPILDMPGFTPDQVRRGALEFPSVARRPSQRHDPFASPFGDVPICLVPIIDFSSASLPPARNADGGGITPSSGAVVRNFFKRFCHA